MAKITKEKQEATIVDEKAGKNTVMVANQHTGHIIFPRKGEGGVSVNPLILAPGCVTTLSKEEWELRKAGKVVQYYLDRGLLAEVNRGGTCAMDETSTDLPIPENLQDNQMQGKDAVAGVREDRTRTGGVTIG